MHTHELLEPACRVALAAYLHDLGKFTERDAIAKDFGEELRAGEHADRKREAFRTLKTLRNTLAHGTAPDDPKLRGVLLRGVLRDPQALRNEIDACLNRLRE